MMRFTFNLSPVGFGSSPINNPLYWRPYLSMPAISGRACMGKQADVDKGNTALGCYAIHNATRRYICFVRRNVCDIHTEICRIQIPTSHLIMPFVILVVASPCSSTAKSLQSTISVLAVLR